MISGSRLSPDYHHNLADNNVNNGLKAVYPHNSISPQDLTPWPIREWSFPEVKWETSSVPARSSGHYDSIQGDRFNGVLSLLGVSLD